MVPGSPATASPAPAPSHCVQGESSCAPGPAKGQMACVGHSRATGVNAKHMLTRLLVQVRGRTASQVSSTRLIKHNAQQNHGIPFLRLPFVNGFKWDVNAYIKDIDVAY